MIRQFEQYTAYAPIRMTTTTSTWGGWQAIDVHCLMCKYHFMHGTASMCSCVSRTLVRTEHGDECASYCPKCGECVRGDCKMTLESIENLRELASEISKGDIDAHLKSGPLGDGVSIDWLVVWHRKFDELINSIQAEVDEKYMILPVDADGVPIRPNEDLWNKDTGEHIDGQCVYGVSSEYVYIFETEKNTICGYYPSHYTHIKPEVGKKAVER